MPMFRPTQTIELFRKLEATHCIGTAVSMEGLPIVVTATVRFVKDVRDDEVISSHKTCREKTEIAAICLTLLASSRILEVFPVNEPPAASISLYNVLGSGLRRSQAPLSNSQLRCLPDVAPKLFSLMLTLLATACNPSLLYIPVKFLTR